MIAAEEFGKSYESLANTAKLWKESAEAAAKPWLADIMNKYGEAFQKQADTLKDSTLSALDRLVDIEVQSKNAVESAEKLLGGEAAKKAGPIVDAAQMLAGAWEWYQTGESLSFGQACAGVIFSAGAGYIAGVLVAGAAGLIGVGGVGVAAAIAVFAGIGAFVGATYGGDAFKLAYPQLQEWIGEFGEWSGAFAGWDSIQRFVNDTFFGAQTARRRDPLVLDLDNDGIETIGVGGDSTILFDHDADGIKTGTGWVKGDDGFLVLDRNQNGSIDTGGELFGVDTVLPDGSKARDGFAALKPLDSNGDGVFSAGDTEFSKVQVWRDLNQDGISQAEELKSLAETGIASIHLTPTSTNTALPGGNVQTAAGNFTRSNGASGTVADAAISGIGNLDLVDNPFYREFPDTIPSTAATATLPDMAGSGAVRDLRQAATLSSALAATLTAVQTASTRETLRQNLDLLLKQWADSAEVKPEQVVKTPHYEIISWGGDGWLTQACAEVGIDLWGPGGVQKAIDEGIITSGFGYVEPGPPGHIPQPSDYRLIYSPRTVVEQFFLAQSEQSKQIKILEIFNGAAFVQPWMIFNFPVPGYTGMVSHIQISSEQSAFIEQSYSALQRSVYSALAAQSYLKPYIDLIELSISETGISFSFEALNAKLAADYASDTRLGIGTAADLLLTVPNLTEMGWDGASRLGEWLHSHEADADFTSILSDAWFSPYLGQAGTFASDWIYGKAWEDSIRGGEGNDFIIGAGGDDILDGGLGNDLLFGGIGKDRLSGAEGNDLLLGGADFDTLDGGNGSDTLDGGAGHDTLTAGMGSDTYVFRQGDGWDVVSNIDWSTGRIDTVRFADTKASDLRGLRREGNDLIIQYGSHDEVRMERHYGSGAAWLIDRFEFSDGQVLSVNQLLQRYRISLSDKDENSVFSDAAEWVVCGAGKDVIAGAGGNDTLQGDAGMDTLYGEEGDDLLVGGADVDSLFGGSGNDTLDGGAGNEALGGGDGSDTYIFRLGDGSDTLYGSADQGDSIRFSDIKSSELVGIRRLGDNLIVQYGSSDEVHLLNHFSGPANELINRFEFSDGQIFSLNQLLESGPIVLTASSDNLIFSNAGERVHAGAGNDTIFGRGGNDVLIMSLRQQAR